MKDTGVSGTNGTAGTAATKASPPGGLPVVDNIHLVGRRNPLSLLQCNTYLRTFPRGKQGDLHWCVDPGSRVDYATVRLNLLHHIGSMRRLRLASLNHQDPDVVGNLNGLTDESDDLVVLASEDSWRLVQHLDAHPKHLYFPGRHTGNLIKLAGGNRVQAVPTPFCHFRGAMAFYDLETRVLFSGDLFGGLNEPGRVQLYAEERDWPGIAIFHQIYMPSRVCTAYAIRQIRALEPPVEVIAPQHGFLLAGEFMRDVMARLESLPVGMDRLSLELDESFFEAYQDVLRELLRVATEHLGQAEVVARLEAFAQQPAGKRLIHVADGEIELLVRGLEGLPAVVDALAAKETGFRNVLRHAVLSGCHLRSAPLPDIAPGMEAEGQLEWLG